MSIQAGAADEVVAAVSEREYRRLLQLPRGRPLSADLRERALGARRWYAVHGRPFVAARCVGVGAIDSGAVLLESGTVLTSAMLATRLREGEAHALVAVAASAGPEVADAAARLWDAGRPDEAYFLDRLAAAIAEGLLVRAAAAMCRDLAPRRERLLPHLSPGCGHWDLADQRSLMRLLAGVGRPARTATPDLSAALEFADVADSCGPVTLLASGALRPQHSVLAAFGVTHQADAATTVASSCRDCDLDPCDFRRVSFRRDTPCSRVTA